MKKLYALGARAGLNAGEVNRIARFGVLGLMTVALASLAACLRAQKPQAAPSQAEKPQTLQDLAGSVSESTAAAKPAADNCGPYPGYPCGTRYYTVSVKDFRGQT